MLLGAAAGFGLLEAGMVSIKSTANILMKVCGFIGSRLVVRVAPLTPSVGPSSPEPC